MRLILTGLPLPVPVNRQWRVTKRGVFLTKEARVKRDLIVSEVHKQLGGPPETITVTCMIQMQWTPRDRRIADVDAYIKGAMDALTKASVWADDNLVDYVSCERLVKPKYPGHWDCEIWTTT